MLVSQLQDISSANKVKKNSIKKIWKKKWWIYKNYKSWF
jgi:hypothetical protein